MHDDAIDFFVCYFNDLILVKENLLGDFSHFSIIDHWVEFPLQNWWWPKFCNIAARESNLAEILKLVYVMYDKALVRQAHYGGVGLIVDNQIRNSNPGALLEFSNFLLF